MSETPKRPAPSLTFKVKLPKCDLTDQLCDKLNAPSGMECLCCILGAIRSELADIAEEISVLNKNLEARKYG